MLNKNWVFNGACLKYWYGVTCMDIFWSLKIDRWKGRWKTYYIDVRTLMLGNRKL